MTLCQRLHYLRTRLGLTHQELASKMGVDRSTSIKWETGASKLTRYLQKLADFYGVSVDYILNGDPSDPQVHLVDLIDYVKYGMYKIGNKPVRPEDRVKLLSALIAVISALDINGDNNA